MKKLHKAKFKEFAKFLLLAQTASDAGKDGISTAAVNGKKAIVKNYSIKEEYILQAIFAAKDLPMVKIGKSGDISMTVVLFDIQGYGQVSFHTFLDYEKLNLSTKIWWNGIRGGSVMTCEKLARSFNLPWYNHGRKPRNSRKRG